MGSVQLGDGNNSFSDSPKLRLAGAKIQKLSFADVVLLSKKNNCPRQSSRGE